jgi:hypothetical protein
MTAAGAPPDRPIETDGLFDRIRDACATVAGGATRVHIDRDALDCLADTLHLDDPPLLPEERPSGDEAHVAATVVAWNAVNFGSGWFPHLRKGAGLSGARSLATAFAKHVERSGPPVAEWLVDAEAATCAAVFDQPYPGPVDDLLDLFAQAWRDLGSLLLDRFGGSAAELVAAAGASAERLVAQLAEMPLAHDVVQYGDMEVPLLKRAQITASHLARAFGGQGLGHFDDLARLTAFADNLVPHVLRMTGGLVYDDGLAAHIDRHDLLEPGSPDEVEIRACGLHAVEILASTTGATPAVVDHQLWQRGQDPAIKAVPRHRCRCSWY